VSAEHPLSDRAVAATRGEILAFEGRPISALYTATCGGHTEHGFEIFPEERGPYLKGVPCRAEAAALATLRGRIEGRAAAPRVVETGADVTRDWALLASAGVLDEASDASAPASAAELSAWMVAAGKLSGRAPGKKPVADTTSLASSAQALVEGMGWGERARVLLADDDLPALLRDPEAGELDGGQRRALAVLVLAGAVEPLADGTYGAHAPVSRGRIAAALARICDTYDAFALREASVAAVLTGRVRFVQGKGTLELPLAQAPYLFSLGGERPVPARTLELWPGDRVRYRTDAQGRVAFLELRPPVKGSSDDRYAKVYSWEVRMTRAELEEALRRRIDVGKLLELDVVRRGVSGRIVELAVRGERGRSVVKGFDVRTLLGLRESLTVVEPQRDAEGEIAAVVFAGKGWGHGVGLCQVGAYGMALRGAKHGEILGHYYRGAALETIP
jgi:stage II sporulation protein D